MLDKLTFFRDVKVRFVFVGILNTAVGYIVYTICIFGGMIYQIALLVTYIFGIANSYLWNKYFTFQVRQASFAEVLRFISVYAVIYGVNILILHVCVDIMKFSAYYSGIGVLSLTTLASYFAHKKISFRYKHAPKAK